MIYLDSSIALAHLLGEPRQPDAKFWDERFIASRLTLYEVHNRLNALGVAAVSQILAATFANFALVDLTQEILKRALERFPIPVRTLDGLHLATAHHLRVSGVPVSLASYDVRMLAAAEALGIPLVVF